jgi:hypothetical protein
VDEGTEVEGSRYAPSLAPPEPPPLHAAEGEPLTAARFGEDQAAVSETAMPPLPPAGANGEGEPPTQITQIGEAGFGDVELSRAAGPGEGAMDYQSTSLIDRSTSLEAQPSEPAALLPGADDEWHEAPTGSFDVPPLPPPAQAASEEPVDDDLGGATRILTRPRLVENGNGGGPREHLLALGRTSIGRASDNVVHLLDEAVSRHHAEIVPGPHGFLLRDLGSENGIYVNGERTPEHVLHDGDVIQIGARTLVYKDA